MSVGQVAKSLVAAGMSIITLYSRFALGKVPRHHGEQANFFLYQIHPAEIAVAVGRRLEQPRQIGGEAHLDQGNGAVAFAGQRLPQQFHRILYGCLIEVAAVQFAYLPDVQAILLFLPSWTIPTGIEPRP